MERWSLGCSTSERSSQPVENPVLGYVSDLVCDIFNPNPSKRHQKALRNAGPFDLPQALPVWAKQTLGRPPCSSRSSSHGAFKQPTVSSPSSVKM